MCVCISGKLLTDIGLVLDIVGAFLLWKFVVEINFTDKEQWLSGNAVLVVSDPTPEQIKKFRRNMVISRLAICLLIAGFAFQLLGNQVK